MSHKVLIIEDEENLLEALKYNFKREGYEVVTATDGASGLEAAQKANPDVVILDVILPQLDGFEVCRLLRREANVPIIMLTAKGEEIDRVVGLELGADDYVVKPFSVRELLARVKALLRRAHPISQSTPDLSPSSEVVKQGDLELDRTSYVATLRDTRLNLTRREFDLLALLMRNRGKVFTRDEILQRVWGYDYAGDSRTVDVHVRWLRQKIESDPKHPKSIVTIRGVGYRFEG